MHGEPIHLISISVFITHGITSLNDLGQTKTMKVRNGYYNEQALLEHSKYLPVSKSCFKKSYGQNRKETHCQVCIFCKKRFITVECLKFHLRHHSDQIKILQHESEKVRIKLQTETMITFSNILLMNNLYLKQQLLMKDRLICILELLLKNRLTFHT